MVFIVLIVLIICKPMNNKERVKIRTQEVNLNTKK